MASIKNLKVSGTSYSINAFNADKLASARTIGLSGAAEATATNFDGSANISIPVNEVKEGYLTWGGKHHSGKLGPLEVALSAEHSANRIAYLNPNAIQIEYSTDGGATYTDYGADNTTKVCLVTTATTLYVGKSGNATTSGRMRVTLTGQDGTNDYCYTKPRKLLINVSTSGHGLSVLVEVKKGASGASWEDLGTYALSGWSGWNDIPLSQGTFGGSASQTSNYWYLRLTFITTSINSTYASSLSSILGLRLFGDTSWIINNKLAETGHLYGYDASQNASFPANVSATSFNGYKISTSTAKNTIVARDASGYTNVNYINSNTSNSENPSVNQIIVTNGSDNYYRKASLAHVKSALGSMPASDVYAWAKASTKPTYSWSEISSKPTAFETVIGNYTGNGGAQKPSYIGANATRFNMMSSFVNSSGDPIQHFGNYADVMMMNNYSWSDVPYATAIAIQKTNGVPRAWIAAGPEAGWAGATELITANNINANMAEKVSNSAPTLSWGATATVGTIGGKALTVTMPSNPNTNTAHAHGVGTGLTISGSGGTSGTTTYSANLNSTTSLGTIGSTSKLYAVGVDANGKLCVNVPWTDTNTTYTSLKNPYTLYIQGNGTSLGSYDGSSTATFNITYSNVGAAAASHSHSNYVPTSRTVNGKALSSNITLTAGDVGAAASSHSHNYLPLTGGTLTGDTTLNAGTALQLNTLKLPSSSSGTTYTTGTSGYCLKTNGTTVYWGADNNTNTYGLSSNTSSKIYLIGRTTQSSSSGTTYSHDTVYVGTDGYIYSNSKKVDMSLLEWQTF